VSKAVTIVGQNAELGVPTLYRIVTIIPGLAQVGDNGIWRQKNQFRLP
jgi:hypothetical protein